ncbi:MAG: hypothetical protein ACJ71S_06755 [Acidobacteriaceae bacterium]
MSELYRRMVLITVPLVLVVCALVLTFRGGHSRTVFEMTNDLGPVAQSLYFHHNLNLTFEGGPFVGPVVFHSARMPIPPAFLAISYRVFGDRLKAIYVFKTCLFLLPLILSMWLAYSRASREWLAVGLLIAPFFIPNFLLQITSMQIEEGFYYGFLALATAILIFVDRPLRSSWLLAFAVSLMALYLCKSSLRFVCIPLLILACLRIANWTPRVALIGVVAITMLSWGLYQKTVSGRFTIGSSLDGLNLHKGNYAEFLQRYPPSDNGYIDRWDGSLNPVHAFSSEWQFNDYHWRIGERFIKNHKGATVKADLVKLDIYWLGLRDIGSGHFHDVFTRVDFVNMALMRLILLVSLVLALYCMFRVSPLKFAATATLVIFASVCFPYLVGFALTRHASVLIYPAALFLTRVLAVQS